MMRFLLLIFLLALFEFACVKPKTTNPVPHIAYENMLNMGKVCSQSLGCRDTADLVISYEDGDGDLFVDNNTQGPTLSFIPFYMDSTSPNFKVMWDKITNDTLRIINTIKQPDNGYYKGKSIKGDIYIPLTQFRPNDYVRKVKFMGYVTDIKGHKSNVITTPEFSTNF